MKKLKRKRKYSLDPEAIKKPVKKKKRGRKKKAVHKKKKIRNRTPKSVRAKYKIEALERLACAIITKAVEDYRNAGFEYKKLIYKLEHGYLMNPDKVVRLKDKYLTEMRLDETFLRNNKFTNLDPDFVMEELNKQIDEYNPAEHISAIKKGGRTRGRI